MARFVKFDLINGEDLWVDAGSVTAVSSFGSGAHLTMQGCDKPSFGVKVSPEEVFDVLRGASAYLVED